MTLESVKALCPDPSVLGIPVLDHGWHSEKPEFAEIVTRQDHKLIVEVGSWFGQSALRMAALCPNAIVVCVDTFLGSTDHMPFRLPRNMGFPDIYRQFLMNTASSPYADRIFPLVQTSRNAARLLKSLPYKPTLCYIDGSHESPDVLDDMTAYYELLAKGGTIFGDDYGNPDHPGVKGDVDEFMCAGELTWEVLNGFWVTKKA